MWRVVRSGCGCGIWVRGLVSYGVMGVGRCGERDGGRNGGQEGERAGKRDSRVEGRVPERGRGRRVGMLSLPPAASFREPHARCPAAPLPRPRACLSGQSGTGALSLARPRPPRVSLGSCSVLPADPSVTDN